MVFALMRPAAFAIAFTEGGDGRQREVALVIALRLVVPILVLVLVHGRGDLIRGFQQHVAPLAPELELELVDAVELLVAEAQLVFGAWWQQEEPMLDRTG